MKKLIFACIAVVIALNAYSQDSNHVKYQRDTTPILNKSQRVQSRYDNSITIHAQPPYRDTRLGSSTPQYNTYKKNDYGAGAITTNPNKWGGGTPEITSAQSAYPGIQSSGKSHHIYRDTRLGSSSPMYNTYKKNDKGAGAVTTNPNKWGSGMLITMPNPEASLDTTQIGNVPVREMTKRDN